MLSELAKTQIKRATRITCKCFGFKRVAALGPSKLLGGIERILDDESMDRIVLLEVVANREEAEQLIAGLLGMM